MPPSDGTIQASSVTRIHIFSDDSGNFDFSRGKGATQYFILTTVTSADRAFGAQLLELRRRMAWNRLGLNEDFHATENSQAVRDRIFEALQEASFVVNTTMTSRRLVRTTDSSNPTSTTSCGTGTCSGSRESSPRTEMKYW